MTCVTSDAAARQDSRTGSDSTYMVADGERHLTGERAREVELWRRYRFGGSFMPVIRHELRERAARRLLEEDSTSSGARLVLGLLEMDIFRQAHNRVQLPLGLVEGNRIDTWLGFLDVGVEQSGSEAQRLVRDDAVAARHAEQTRNYLLPVLDDAFWARQAGEALAELAVRTQDVDLLYRVATKLQAYGGDFSARAHEYWTLHHIMNDEVNAAVKSFAAARQAMAAERRAQVWDLRLLAPPSLNMSDSLNADWLDKDPLWMTGGNERAAEHLARMVAAELLFGVWNNRAQAHLSDPGQLLLRYGIPTETVQFSSDSDGFLVMEYPDQYFLFHDMAKAGKWIYFSSSAASLTGPRSVAPQWERDFVLRAQEAFDAQPDRTRMPGRKRAELDAAWYTFTDPGQLTAVTAWCVPNELADVGMDMGLYGVADGSQRIEQMKEWTVSGRGEGSEDPCIPKIERVDVSPGAWRFSLEAVATDVYGVSRHRSKVSTMSSVVPARLIVDKELGDTPPDGFFERGDVWIQPLVPPETVAGGFVSVYAEASDIPAGTQSVFIEAVLRSDREKTRRWWLRGNRNEAVSVRFEQNITGARARVRVVLDLAHVKPGAYELIVRVTGDSYATENQVALVVKEDEDG